MVPCPLQPYPFTSSQFQPYSPLLACVSCHLSLLPDTLVAHPLCLVLVMLVTDRPCLLLASPIAPPPFSYWTLPATNLLLVAFVACGLPSFWAVAVCARFLGRHLPSLRQHGSASGGMLPILCCSLVEH
jgi:hypothetical protein